MNLHEQMQNDVAVFLNPDGFGECIRIEGIAESVPAVCDWSVTPEGEHLYAGTDSWGINSVRATVELAESVVQTAFGELSPGCELVINDRSWTVRGVKADGGLMTLNLFRNVS